MIRRRVLAAASILALSDTAWAQGLAVPHRSAPAVPLALPAGMSPLPQGAWRVAFRAGEQSLSPAVQQALAEIGRRLAATPAGHGRITVQAQASGPPNDASAARRLSLARAVAVRQALVAGGLAETRVDVRALGRTQAALDAADILPPAAQPQGAPARAPDQ